MTTIKKQAYKLFNFLALPWLFTVVSVHIHKNRTQLIVMTCILSPSTRAAKENKKTGGWNTVIHRENCGFSFARRDCSMIYASLCRPPAKSWQGTEKREDEHTHSTLCDTLVLQKNLENTFYWFMSKTNQNDNTDDGGSLIFSKGMFWWDAPALAGFHCVYHSVMKKRLFL